MVKKEQNKAIKYVYIVIGMLLIISSFRPEVIRSLREWEDPRAMGYNIATIFIIVLAIWLIRKGLTKQ